MTQRRREKMKGKGMKKRGHLFCLSLIFLGAILFWAEPTDISASMQEVKGGCGSGPCLSMSRNCGYTHSGTTCALYETACEGVCSIRCQGNVPSQYCAVYLFRCDYTVVRCAARRRPVCTPFFSGPPRCACPGDGGKILGECTRGFCD